MSEKIRLNKFLAENVGISRREADQAISRGQVEVGGQTAVLGQQITGAEQIRLTGRLVEKATEAETMMLNKPVGYLSSRRSQGGNPTIYDLLPPEFKKLKTAGRLDKDSSGLMILSSDGDLIQQLTHPRYQKVKIYEIELDKPLKPLHQQMIADFGIDLPDGKSRLTLEKSDEQKHWRVTMHEGRNRQIRRTFEALGYTVTELHRTDLGTYHLRKLPSGKWCRL
jgi:23S rRNA pseudouridine2605 synthase